MIKFSINTCLEFHSTHSIRKTVRLKEQFKVHCEVLQIYFQFNKEMSESVCWITYQTGWSLTLWVIFSTEQKLFVHLLDKNIQNNM